MPGFELFYYGDINIFFSFSAANKSFLEDRNSAFLGLVRYDHFSYRSLSYIKESVAK